MSSEVKKNDLSSRDLEDLTLAKKQLTRMSLAARISSLIGTPIEAFMTNLPDKVSNKIMEASTLALTKAADAAVFTMKDKSTQKSSDILHKLSVAVSGGVGGTFGLAALAVELPISTTLMIRSIADIARSEGENISDIGTKLACMEVFALGGPTAGDDGTESGYFAVRAALNSSINAAAKFVAEHGLKGSSAPIIVKFISSIAERFSIVITEKAAAQAIPVVGAVGGAVVNTLFISHFQDIARGHFVVRRLERKYGKKIIEQAFDEV
ncbi:MAG: EcsC family protein [Flavobacteriales bacterium]|nr:EcsC family protein [Flavobacteriales bacterium]